MTNYRYNLLAEGSLFFTVSLVERRLTRWSNPVCDIRSGHCHCELGTGLWADPDG
jgi:hypothetical protein